jgi:hypothetical protein
MNDHNELLEKIKCAKRAIENLPDGPEKILWIRLHNKHVIALRSSAGAKLKVESSE